MSLFTFKKTGVTTAYIEIPKSDYAERSISIPDTGLVLDFNKDDELIGIESIDFQGDFTDEFIEEFEKQRGDDE